MRSSLPPTPTSFLVRLFAAASRSGRGPLRVLTSDGEFHSARRQFARWAEEPAAITLERMSPSSRSTAFPTRFLEAARAGEHDFIFVSQVLFGSGRIFDRVDELAALGRPEGPWVVIDGYHAFMALDRPFGECGGEQRLLPRRRLQICDGWRRLRVHARAAGLRAPGRRITGWFAEFEDLSLPPGQRRLCEGREPLPRRDLRSFRRSTASPRFGGCSPITASTTARISAPCRCAAAQAARQRSPQRHWPPPNCSTRSTRPACALPRLPQPARAALVRCARRRRTASPTCAATCFGSASAFTRTRATSTALSELLGELA